LQTRATLGVSVARVFNPCGRHELISPVFLGLLRQNLRSQVPSQRVRIVYDRISSHTFFAAAALWTRPAGGEPLKQ
jgi:hypothetical protein